MSISGWYHGPEEPAGAQNASLQQLQQQQQQQQQQLHTQQTQQPQGGNEQGLHQNKGAEGGGGFEKETDSAPLAKGADLLAASQYLPFGPKDSAAGV